MGCDIHIVAQKRQSGRWTDLTFKPFNWRSYGTFGFLADVRNYSFVPPISQPRGLPSLPSPTDFRDLDIWDDWQLDLDMHSHSWLSVDELRKFDYDATFEDRRTTAKVGRITDGAVDAGEGNGNVVTFREFLGHKFFHDLDQLEKLGAERIVFCFDN